MKDILEGITIGNTTIKTIAGDLVISLAEVVASSKINEALVVMNGQNNTDKSNALKIEWEETITLRAGARILAAIPGAMIITPIS